MITKCSVAPMLPLYPRNGNIVIKRHVKDLGWDITVNSLVDFSYNNGWIESPSSTQGVLFCASYETKDGLGLTITAVRLDALDHPHEDHTQARDCGRLSFRINPFAISEHANLELNIINHQGLSSEPATQEKLNLMPFPTSKAAQDYGYDVWHQIKHKHDMVRPRDEWKISAIGLADVSISVERFFFDECNSDGNSSDDELHPFVDVLDIVVTANAEDNTVKENGDQQQIHNDGTYEKDLTGETVEENITKIERRKRSVLERMRRHIRIKHR
ncbi:hypothetical protein F4782DRAFT_245457 [Xylaria castorea]|nr:hypothetical protein F4782DRAFT_245457 [Xylaria castorea]